ncbi:RDD family protein [Halomonas organivorans]|uniref:Putative RDD family membrane protein YckC n=1 Tax=Halomonas organivorans TaxID=257772 RepID=A0A7W5BUY4_9GAMM|nr:RDD family protein [Halomonas organivorans]MBB3139515.1 putative RDD family membrane protein YckC [Halomonas organivorans]
MPRRFDRLDDVWPAGLGRRLGAMLYDGLLVLALWILIAAVHVAVSRLAIGLSPERVGLGAAQVWSLRALMAGAACLFFTYFWTRGGMTLGMQAWRLRVQTTDGHAIGWRQSLVRCVVGALAFLPLGLGHLWVLFDGEKRSWADIASGTRLVVLPGRR